MSDGFVKKEQYGYDDLLAVMDVLMGEGGCPWDAAQTHESIRGNLLEEAYEAVEAIDKGDTQNLIEEMGDVLLQAVFHGKIAQREGAFDCGTVVDSLCKKLIFRHPHVFGASKARDAEGALQSWEQAKSEEKEQATLAATLRSIPLIFPQSMRAVKVAKRAAKAKIGAGASVDVYRDVILDRLSGIEKLQTAAEKEKAIGECFFALSNLAAKVGAEPEIATKKVIDGYITRFERVEAKFAASGQSIFDAAQDAVNRALVEVIYAEATGKKQ